MNNGQLTTENGQLKTDNGDLNCDFFINFAL